MQFLTMREFSKSPKVALSRLNQDGKAVLTNNGKPAAFMINVDDGNFERIFDLVREVEKRMTSIHFYVNTTSDEERDDDAFERLMNFPRAELPADFDYKKELTEAIDARFNGID